MTPDNILCVLAGWFAGVLTVLTGMWLDDVRQRRAARRYVRWLHDRDETQRRQRLAQTMKPI